MAGRGLTLSSVLPFSVALSDTGVLSLGPTLEKLCFLGAGEGGFRLRKDGDSGGVRLLLELVLGAGTGGTGLGVLIVSEVFAIFFKTFGDIFPSTRFTVTPSSIALSAKGCGSSSFGFAPSPEPVELIETESADWVEPENDSEAFVV